MSLNNTQIEDIIIWLVIGVVAGWLATRIMRSKRGIVEYTLLGVIGAIVGGFLFSTLNLGNATSILGQIVIATVGAVLVLAVVGN